MICSLRWLKIGYVLVLAVLVLLLARPQPSRGQFREKVIRVFPVNDIVVPINPNTNVAMSMMGGQLGMMGNLGGQLGLQGGNQPLLGLINQVLAPGQQWGGGGMMGGQLGLAGKGMQGFTGGNGI